MRSLVRVQSPRPLKILFMKYAFVVVAVLAVWLGVILLAICNPGMGIFLPVFAVAMTVVLFLIGFGKKK